MCVYPARAASLFDWFYLSANKGHKYSDKNDNPYKEEITVSVESNPTKVMDA